MIASTKVTEKAEKRWSLIVERFREACVSYKNGREDDSRRIVREELPDLIKAWIRLLPTALKDDAKADLRDMFAKEQAIVDQGIKLQNIFKETLVKRIIPKVEEQVAAKYRSLYLKEQLNRRGGHDKAASQSWLQAAYGSDTESSDKRVSLRDVNGMIDAVQGNETEALASSVLSLDEIVGTLNRNHIDPTLAE